MKNSQDCFENYIISALIWRYSMARITRPTTGIHKYFYVKSFYSLQTLLTLIARFMGPTWGPPGADRTQVVPMLAPWTLLSGYWSDFFQWNHGGSDANIFNVVTHTACPLNYVHNVVLLLVFLIPFKIIDPSTPILQGCFSTSVVTLMDMCKMD